MGTYIKGFVLAIVLVFLITFGIKNSHPVQTEYFFEYLSFSIPLYALVYLSVIIGIIIGLLMGLPKRLGLRRKIKDLERENKRLEAHAETKQDASTRVEDARASGNE